jgi:hypothetical protein
MKAFLPTLVVCPAGFQFARRSSLSLGLALLLALPPGAPLAAQPRLPAPAKLSVTVVEGENGINLTQKRTSRTAVVRVQDDKSHPIQGAAVIFTLPDSGPGGVFGASSRSLLVRTDGDGRAAARGFRANDIQGKFQIQVRVAFRDVTATTGITQVNMLQSQVARKGFFTGGKIALLAAVGAAAVAAVVVTGRGSSGTADIGISPGTATIGGPR